MERNRFIGSLTLGLVLESFIIKVSPGSHDVDITCVVEQNPDRELCLFRVMRDPIILLSWSDTDARCFELR